MAAMPALERGPGDGEAHRSTEPGVETGEVAEDEDADAAAGAAAAGAAAAGGAVVRVYAAIARASADAAAGVRMW